jgi:carbon-monoxide dehydrogenase medium subunit
MGGNLAEADYTSDPPCVLTALDATVRLRSADGGERTVPVTELFTDYFETVIRPDEFLTGVTVPVLADGWHGTYLKFLSRSAEDRTCLGIAAFVRQDEDGRCTGMRVAVSGGTPVPLRLRAVEEGAVGRRLAEPVLAAVGAAYAEAADPVSDLRGSEAYRRKVLGPLVARALRRAAAGADDAVVA